MYTHSSRLGWRVQVGEDGTGGVGRCRGVRWWGIWVSAFGTKLSWSKKLTFLVHWLMKKLSNHELSWVLMSSHKSLYVLMSTHKHSWVWCYDTMNAHECWWEPMAQWHHAHDCSWNPMSAQCSMAPSSWVSMSAHECWFVIRNSHGNSLLLMSDNEC